MRSNRPMASETETAVSPVIFDAKQLTLKLVNACLINFACGCIKAVFSARQLSKCITKNEGMTEIYSKILHKRKFIYEKRLAYLQIGGSQNTGIFSSKKESAQFQGIGYELSKAS